MGAAVASSRAGSDLYEALARWLHRVPGDLVVANIGACALFAALTGSSPATCAAIGKMGIPEMRRRGYPGRPCDRCDRRRRHAGHPDPAVGHHDPLRDRQRDLDRPAVPRRRPARAAAHRAVHGLVGSCAGGAAPRLRRRRPRLHADARSSPAAEVLPFLAVIVGVVYALYGGVATPSEAAGVGALLCARPRRRGLPGLAPGRSVADLARHPARVGDDPDDHRHRRSCSATC